MARRSRKQTILKRDRNGHVVYDKNGRPVADKTVRARSSSFRGTPRGKSRDVEVRRMTDEERERYGIPLHPVSSDERRQIGEAILCLTDDERWFHGY